MLYFHVENGISYEVSKGIWEGGMKAATELVVIAFRYC